MGIFTELLKESRRIQAMIMEKTRFIERAKRKFLPAAAVGILALSGCADDKDNSATAGEKITVIHEDVSELCTKEAQAEFAAKYPSVEIRDNPTLAELQDAVVVLKAKENEGPEFMQDEYVICMEREFDNVVAGLDNGTIVPQDTAVVTETSIAG